MKSVNNEQEMMKLPCARGDKVYRVYFVSNDIEEKTIRGFMGGTILLGPYEKILFEDIGRTVFLSKEEAESKLKTERDAANLLADKVIYWKPMVTIAASETDWWVKCSNCGHEINLYDIERLRFNLNNSEERYRAETKKRYDKCENCSSTMDRALSHILRKKKIFERDYYEDGYKKEIVRILLSNEYKTYI